MAVPMQVTPGELPIGFCPSSEQQRLNTYASALAVTFPLGLGNFTQGNAAPPVDMQGFPWFRYNADGSPDRWYVYFNGSWVSPNPVAAQDAAAIRFHPGPYGAIATYDGGDTLTPGPAAGPMWQVIGQTTGGSTDYGTYGGTTLVGVNAVFGEGQTGQPPNGSTTPSTTLGMVTESADNIPAHGHLARVSFLAGSAQVDNRIALFDNLVPDNQCVGNLVIGGNNTGQDSSGNPLPPKPFWGFPWAGAYFIGRTSRIFYRV